MGENGDLISDASPGVASSASTSRATRRELHSGLVFPRQMHSRLFCSSTASWTTLRTPFAVATTINLWLQRFQSAQDKNPVSHGGSGVGSKAKARHAASCLWHFQENLGATKRGVGRRRLWGSAKTCLQRSAALAGLRTYFWMAPRAHWVVGSCIAAERLIGRFSHAVQVQADLQRRGTWGPWGRWAYPRKEACSKRPQTRWQLSWLCNANHWFPNTCMFDHVWHSKDFKGLRLTAGHQLRYWLWHALWFWLWYWFWFWLLWLLCGCCVVVDPTWAILRQCCGHVGARLEPCWAIFGRCWAYVAASRANSIEIQLVVETKSH